MVLTRSFKLTVAERVAREPAFAQALLDEAATLFFNGEPETARLILRELVNATMGFEQLAALTARPSKSLHRMLSTAGNPSMDNLAAIIDALRLSLSVRLEARSVALPVKTARSSAKKSVLGIQPPARGATARSAATSASTRIGLVT